MPDAMACLAASSALAMSTVPIQEVISEVRVSAVQRPVQNQSHPRRNGASDIDFIIAATEKNIMMVEGEAKECSEEDLVQALQVAHDAIRIQIKAQLELSDMLGVGPKRDYPRPEQNETIRERVNELGTAKMDVLARANVKKAARKEQTMPSAKASSNTAPGSQPARRRGALPRNAKDRQELSFRPPVRRGKRYDPERSGSASMAGVSTRCVRWIWRSMCFLAPHGAALFTRGETQSLTTVTLGTPLDELLIESAAKSEYSKFIFTIISLLLNR
jgi:polyribonucleotide nucleotidyltransferase